MKDHTGGKICECRELTLFVDGGCEPNPGGVASCAWVLYHGQERVADAHYLVADGGKKATVNVAEYCGLGYALRWLSDQGWRGSLRVKSDSRLVVNQVLGKWKVKAVHLRPLRQRIWNLMEELDLERIDTENEGMLYGPDGDINPTKSPCVLEWIPRTQNEVADALSTHARQYYRTHKDEGEEGKVRFRCGCGYRGDSEELVDDDGTLRCPICETSGFEYL